MNSFLRGALTALANAALLFAIGCSKKPPDEYYQALELIHSTPPTGVPDAIQKIRDLSLQIEKKQPKSGLPEALYAEMKSTWDLQQPLMYPTMAPMISQYVENALSINPELVQPHVSRARAKLIGGRYDEARAELEPVLKAEPGNVYALLLMAELQTHAKNFDAAAANARKAIDGASAPMIKANGHYALAQIYRQRALLDEPGRADWISKARTAYENALNLAPGNGKRALDYAEFLCMTVHDYAAAELYANSAGQDGRLASARYLSALAQYLALLPRIEAMDKQTLDAAVGDVGRKTSISLADAVSVAPTNLIAGSRLAAYLGDPSGFDFDPPALNPLTRKKELEPAASEMLAKAIALLDGADGDPKQLDEAAVLLAVVIKTQPFHAEAYRELARYHLLSDELGGPFRTAGPSRAAQKNLFKVVSLVPDDASAMLALARLFSADQKPLEARFALEKGRAGIYGASAELDTAEAYLLWHDDKRDESLAKFEAAVQHAKPADKPAAIQDYARFLERHDDLVKAEKQFLLLIEASPNTARYHGDLARMLACRTNEIDRAVQVARHALELRSYHYGRQALATALLLRWAENVGKGDATLAEDSLAEALTMSYPHPPQVVSGLCGPGDAVKKVNDAFSALSMLNPMYFQPDNLGKIVARFKQPRI